MKTSATRSGSASSEGRGNQHSQHRCRSGEDVRVSPPRGPSDPRRSPGSARGEQSITQPKAGFRRPSTDRTPGERAFDLAEGPRRYWGRRGPFLSGPKEPNTIHLVTNARG